ncbi:MAG TPA: rhomboid family intramembrane serine protease, partial [archaeon]|nr:rhomboid family intramembrane serine protease [archaeon]
IPLPFIIAGALFLIFNFSGLFLPSDVAYPAHIGGMFVGALFGLAWGQKRIRNLILFVIIILIILGIAYVV